MRKDFATIKKMANKKLLGLKEKEVLTKLYEAKIKEKKEAIQKAQAKIYEQAEIDTFKKISQKAIVKNAIKLIDKSEQDIENAELLLKKNGVKYDKNYSDDKKKLELRINSHYTGEGRIELAEAKKLETLQNEQAERINKINLLQVDIKLALYLPTMTRLEIDEILDNELSKI